MQVENNLRVTFTQALWEIQLLKDEIPPGLFIYAWMPFLDINQHASLINPIPLRQVYTSLHAHKIHTKTKINLIIQTTSGCTEGRCKCSSFQLTNRDII